MKTILIVLLLSFTLLFAQNNQKKIGGLVVDSKTKEPLPFSILIVDGHNYEISTDSKGVFELELNPGVHLLKILCLGYETIVDTIAVKENDNELLSYELNEIDLTIYEKAFVLTKEEAFKNIEEGNCKIFINEYKESAKGVTEAVAEKYGFTVIWPEEVYMIISVDEYNKEMIKHLEERNGKNWYERYLNDVKDNLNQAKKQY